MQSSELFHGNVMVEYHYFELRFEDVVPDREPDFGTGLIGYGDSAGIARIETGIGSGPVSVSIKVVDDELRPLVPIDAPWDIGAELGVRSDGRCRLRTYEVDTTVDVTALGPAIAVQCRARDRHGHWDVALTSDHMQGFYEVYEFTLGRARDGDQRSSRAIARFDEALDVTGWPPQ